MVSHRKRVERLRVSEAAGAAATSLSLPLKWAGPLGEAFEDAVAGLGGLQAARPAAIVALLGPCFPEVTAQVCMGSFFPAAALPCLPTHCL